MTHVPEVAKEDIQAALDVITALTEQIDDLGAEQAIRFRSEVEALQKASKFCHELLTTRAVSSLDGQPIVVEGVVYAVETGGKWRPDHRRIRDMIEDAAIRDAIDPETAEINVRRAVRSAIELCYEAFVSPASMPKQAFVEGLMQVTNKQLSTWERGKKVLRTMPLKEADDDA